MNNRPERCSWDAVSFAKFWEVLPWMEAFGSMVFITPSRSLLALSTVLSVLTENVVLYESIGRIA